MRKIPSSYDIIGSREKAVAIVEIPDELKDREKEIAEGILNRHKNVKSVLKKFSERKGVFRTREYEFLAGDPDTEVIHKESGCVFKLDPKLVYFSGREGAERLRISGMVKPKETILVMFAGVGPYPIVIAKKQPKVDKIISIEINPVAFEYMKENIRLNKVSHKITHLLGDIRDICPKYYGSCDRVIMPLPLGAESFLDISINCLKKGGGIVHFYSSGKEDDLFSNALKQVEESVKKYNKKFEVLNKRKILPYKPRVFKVCIDFKVKRS